MDAFSFSGLLHFLSRLQHCHTREKDFSSKSLCGHDLGPRCLAVFERGGEVQSFRGTYDDFTE